MFEKPERVQSGKERAVQREREKERKREREIGISHSL